MDSLLIDTLLAARKDNIRGWTQLLVFMIMAVVWIVGALVKSKASKTTDSDYDEGQADELPLPSIERIRRQLGIRSVITEPAGEAFEAMGAKDMDIAPKERETASRQADELVQPPKILKTRQKEEKIAEKMFFDFEDTEQLKKAILHYEILGKPIALREQYQF